MSDQQKSVTVRYPRLRSVLALADKHETWEVFGQMPFDVVDALEEGRKLLEEVERLRKGCLEHLSRIASEIDKIQRGGRAASKSKATYPRPLWRFRCEADQVAEKEFRVEVVSDKGKKLTRIGYHPLHELIRILGGKPDQAAGEQEVEP